MHQTGNAQRSYAQQLLFSFYTATRDVKQKTFMIRCDVGNTNTTCAGSIGTTANSVYYIIANSVNKFAVNVNTFRYPNPFYSQNTNFGYTDHFFKLAHVFVITGVHCNSLENDQRRFQVFLWFAWIFLFLTTNAFCWTIGFSRELLFVPNNNQVQSALRSRSLQKKALSHDFGIFNLFSIDNQCKNGTDLTRTIKYLQ